MSSSATVFSNVNRLCGTIGNAEAPLVQYTLLIDFGEGTVTGFVNISPAADSGIDTAIKLNVTGAIVMLGVGRLPQREMELNGSTTQSDAAGSHEFIFAAYILLDDTFNGTAVLRYNGNNVAENVPVKNETCS